MGSTIYTCQSAVQIRGGEQALVSMPLNMKIMAGCLQLHHVAAQQKLYITHTHTHMHAHAHTDTQSTKRLNQKAAGMSDDEDAYQRQKLGLGWTQPLQGG